MFKVLLLDTKKKVLGMLHKQLAPVPCDIVAVSSPDKAAEALKTGEVSALVWHPDPQDDKEAAIVAAALAGGDKCSVILIADPKNPAGAEKAAAAGIAAAALGKPWNRPKLVGLVCRAIEEYAKRNGMTADWAAALAAARSGQAQQARERSGRDETPAPKARPEPGGKVRTVGLIVEERPDVTRIPLLLRQSQHLSLLADKSAARKNPATGRMLANRYKLIELRGEGGLGKVYRAMDTMLNIPVAIKMLEPSLTRSPEAVSDLKQEARIAMRLSHSHIVRLHTLDRHNENYFLVMEYVQGRSLRRVLQVTHGLQMQTVKLIVEVCAGALTYAHSQGVLHKDLKPDNILLAEDGVLKIIDFGIASFVGVADDSHLLIGTPAYMSPEQIRGEALDERTDVYSFGIIAYELLTGRLPMPEDVSPRDVVAAGQLKLDKAPDSVRPVLEKAAAFDREARWTGIPDFAEAFVRASSGNEVAGQGNDNGA